MSDQTLVESANDPAAIRQQVLLAAQMLTAGDSRWEKAEDFARIELRLAPTSPTELDLFNASAPPLNQDTALASFALAAAAIRKAQMERVWQLECRLVPVVRAIQEAGLGVDRNKLSAYVKLYERDVGRLERELRAQFRSPTNLNSPTQLLAGLRNLGCLLTSTKEDDLLASGHPVAKQVVEWRKPARILRFSQSYLEASGADGRIHATFDQIGADTGRFSCAEPNLQGVGRSHDLRACFVPASGCSFVIADYSQIELRLAALLAQDETMLTAFRQGRDIHVTTAALIQGKPPETVSKHDRQLAKAVNFGLLYGQQAEGLVRYARSKYGVELTLEDASQFRRAFFASYQGIEHWHQQARRAAGDRNVTEARTLLGRRRLLPELSVDTKWSRFSTLINHPVQGVSGDIIKLAMCDLADELANTKARIVLTVHDELLVEAPHLAAGQLCAVVQARMVSAAEKLTRGSGLFTAEAVVADSWAEK